MPPDNLSEEGLAESTELDISSNILLVIFFILRAPYLLYFKQFSISFWRWLNISGKLLASWTYISALFTILHTFLLLIWPTTELEDTPDSAQSGDQLENFTQADKPLEKEIRILCPQIIFQPFYTIEVIDIPQFYVSNVDLNLQIHHSLPVHIQQFQIFDPPQLYKNRRLQEFLQGEICCQNFINQDLTVLQPSQIYQDSPPHSTPDIIENLQPPLPSTIQDNIDEDHLKIEHET